MFKGAGTGLDPSCPPKACGLCTSLPGGETEEARMRAAHGFVRLSLEISKVWDDWLFSWAPFADQAKPFKSTQIASSV